MPVAARAIREVNRARSMALLLSGGDLTCGCGALVVGLDEGIDVVSQLFDGGEGSAGEALSLKDREPNLDLVKPGGSGWREVKRHVGMALEPRLVLLVGIQVVEDDMDVLFRIGGDDVVHKAEELAASAALCVGGVDFAGGDVERGEQDRKSTRLN